MAGQNKRAADSAMAGRLKEEGVIRRTTRHPVTGKVISGTAITVNTPKGPKTFCDFYGQIVFGGKS